MNDETSDDQVRAEPDASASSKTRTSTQFFLKGLAISLPPILTLVILIWIGQAVYGYVIYPISELVRFTFAQFIQEYESVEGIVRPDGSPEKFVRPDGLPPLNFCEQNYRLPEGDRRKLTRLQKDLARARESGDEAGVLAFEANLIRQLEQAAYIPYGDKVVPYRDYGQVAARLRPSRMPTTAIGVYMELVTVRYFQSLFNLSTVAVLVTIVLLYFLGRLVTVRVGLWAVTRVETLVLARLPVISNVYSSVKQVTDFFFSERTIKYNRVVAVEYPRRGIYSIGFVTGDSMLEMTVAAREPLVSVLMPTSPMPMTGFTISVPRSQVLDLNLTIDQAFQYCLSCGVLVPEQQRVTPDLLREELAKRLTGDISQLPDNGEPSPADSTLPAPLEGGQNQPQPERRGGQPEQQVTGDDEGSASEATS